MPITVKRDPFARGEYHRQAHQGGICRWCGQDRARLYSYVWWPDDRPEPGEVDHQTFERFCNLGCRDAFSE